MATDAENLLTRRTAICAELAAMSATTAGGKPNSSQSGVDHIGYKKSLYEELAMIDERLQSLSGPWEVVSEGYT